MMTGSCTQWFFSLLSGRTRSRLNRVIETSQDVKQLYGIIRRSGFKRVLWILNYIENILGGHESSACRLPVDSSGRALPWYTYPAIEYLEQLDFSKCDVFEYGSGNSSKFWSQRAQSVVSVESDLGWYETVSRDLSANQKLLLMTETAQYADAIHLNSCCFDVIIIDGRYRFNCAIEAVKRIRHGGLILLDNSDWFPSTAEYLRSAGFNQMDFIGAGPINSYAWCTSLFFQDRFAIPRRCTHDAIAVHEGIVQVSQEDRHVQVKS